MGVGQVAVTPGSGSCSIRCLAINWAPLCPQPELPHKALGCPRLESLLSTWTPGHGPEAWPGQGGPERSFLSHGKSWRGPAAGLRSAGLFALA